MNVVMMGPRMHNGSVNGVMSLVFCLFTNWNIWREKSSVKVKQMQRPALLSQSEQASSSEM